MARIIRRPHTVIDWGANIATSGTGNVLGDGNGSTMKFYQNDSGSIAVFNPMAQAQMPAADVIAVSVGLEQSNGGAFGLYNGWVAGYMRVDGKREPSTRTYKQDGYSGNARQIVGPALYKAGGAAYTLEEINSLSLDVGAAVGPIYPDTKKRWCVCRDAYLVLITADPVKVPTITYPAAGATVETGSVPFHASFAGYDPVQPHRAVFQVARDSAFTSDVRTFVAGWALATDNTSYHTSTPGGEGWTNLGTGTWYVRARGLDFRGNESAWSASRSFVVTHVPITTPSVSAESVSTPYGIRAATFAPVNPMVFNWSGRRYGVRWEFSRNADFSGQNVTWLNLTGGLVSPGTITYDPAPSAEVEPGLNGPQPSHDDPSQYLGQGTWYMRARAEDEWGATGSWSSAVQYVVSHRPTTSGYAPTGGVKFDPESMEVSWTFGDPWPGDQQGSYRVRAYNSGGSQVYDSGQVFSPLARARISPPTSLYGQTLSWDVTVTDGDGVASVTSPRQSFFYSRVPAVTITHPGTVVTSGNPSISWTTTFAHAGQKSYRVRIISETGSKVVYDSGVITGPGSSVTPPQPVLIDGQQCRIVVSVTDQNDLTGTATLHVGAQFVRPPEVPVVAVATSYASEGYVTVHWSRGADPMFTQWRLYRRPAGTDDWVLVGTSSDPSARSMRDWLVAGDEVEYHVAQVASRDGSLVESSVPTPVASLRLPPSTYMLVVPSMEFAIAVKPSGDSFTVSQESHTMRIIGRGDKVNFGAARSREGSLKIPLRNPATATLDRLAIDTFIGSEHQVWLRDPFGTAFPVALSEYTFDRIPGVGRADLGDLDVPYVEVSP